jgi:MFS family permease
VNDAPLGSEHKWAITFSVMLVTVMQVLDTSITNVALPHMQGSFSASIDEMSWVITSYLAANAVVIPASGWLTAVFGRRRFFLPFFMVSAFLFDAPFHRRPRRVDVAGIVLMVVGFGCLQLVLDLGERNDWSPR